MSSIAENLSRVEDAITTACRKAGRSREGVRLMAVSKTHPVRLLLEAAAAGHRLFGENRVQEFAEKAQSLHAGRYTLLRETPAGGPDTVQDASAVQDSSAVRDTIAVHLIGHLQSNKAARAAELFSAVDTVDSLKLAQRLHATAEQLARPLPILLEIKLSQEEAKEGILPDSPELAQLLEQLPALTPYLPLRGLMTVAPIADDPSVARDCFTALRLLRDRLAQQHPRLCFDELSMGMSGDFEAAIEQGATTIRIGTAIFGARPKPA